MTEIDKYQDGIEERADFIAWLNNNVPIKYRQMTETDKCFSAVEDFDAISDISFPKKRDNLVSANKKLAGKIAHAIGNAGEPCERCIRMINSRAVYLARHHDELFTEAAHKLIWMELSQRDEEHAKETGNRESYHTDGLFLLQVQSPYMGCPTLHETHLVFYDENSVFHGRRTLVDRIIKNPSLLNQYPGLKDFREFGGEKPYHFQGINHNFVVVSTEEHSPQSRGFKRTIVDIVARK